ncbi:MAG: hypothetical protein A2041_09000 [Bacteroidetes bacterium GWA2_31_9b]|nr:MAG: hypothetical protein A2041_09000 [Bacteroidetes bacterium GWA2_31_9b]
MKKNMGIFDKAIRIIVALVIAILFFTKIITGTLGIVLLIVAGIFLITSFISFCPLYTIFGLTTCSTEETK